jgi:PKD repeat protein
LIVFFFSSLATLAPWRAWRNSFFASAFAPSRRRGCILLLFFLLPAKSASAGWVDEGWTYRRPVEAAWESGKATGGELAVAEFYTAGHHLPNGADVRVASGEGREIASRVLQVGPGDQVRVVFELQKKQKNYWVYFGNPKPPAPKKGAGPGDVEFGRGLLMEMRQYVGGPVDNAEQVEQAWAKPEAAVVGATMVESPFLGINPFGDQQQTVSKFTGILTAPADGPHSFAVVVDDRGSLYVNGKPVLFATAGPADIRQNANVELKKGPHAITFYHVNAGGDGRFTVAWKAPGAANFEVIPKEALGLFYRGTAGPLAEIKQRKNLVADFQPQYMGECFYANGYSHRYRFTARGTKNPKATYQWDFGDGQSSKAPDPEHMFLTDGVYPVKLTVRIGPNRDTQTIKVAVSRDFSRINNPPMDEPAVQSPGVATYDVARMPPEWLPRATVLHLRAAAMEPMLKVAARMAAEPTHPDPAGATAALAEATQQLLTRGRAADAVKLWSAVPEKSDLQPAAARQLASLLMWRVGDFARAVKVLEPFVAAGDASYKRMHAQAVLLGGKADEGRKLLRQLDDATPPVAPAQRAALSGASARTIEFYITEGDWEAGEAAWEAWSDRFPADFLEGYSVLLRARLMELNKAPAAAAKLGEAFAEAVPGSSYAPQLLDRASKLLAQADPKKSEALRAALKERYPEDPLSQ